MEGASFEPPKRHEHPITPEALPAQLAVQPWIDELVEAHGFTPRSVYVETCWLPILGPTATWLYRRLGSWVEHQAEDLEIDMTDLSVSLGLGEGLGRHSLLAKALGRLAHFEIAVWRGDHLAVRRALPPLPLRHQRQLSYTAAQLHESFVRQAQRRPGQLLR